MAEGKVQTLANHARIVPGFHIFTGLLILINLVWTGYRVFTRPGGDSLVIFIAAVALLQLFRYTRSFPLTVQDRIIRLEERLRLARLLPPDLQARIEEFTVDQLIALRFASDAELSDLARKVLAENLTDRRAIKALVREWRPDHLRA